VRHALGVFVADGTAPCCHFRAVLSLIPAAIAAAANVSPDIRRLLKKRTCLSLTIQGSRSPGTWSEPLRLRRSHKPSAQRRTGKSSCRQPAEIIVADHERSARIVFVASDLWKGFMGVVRTRCSSAIHVLDRFHVAQLLSKAVDTVRRSEVKSLRAAGRPAFLTKARWLLLKRRDNLDSDERGRLRQLLAINLRSVRACLLKEQFDRFWKYRSSLWADRFLSKWTTLAMRSRLEPLKKFARTLRAHRGLLLNWFAARGRFPQGAVEGFNNKARVTTRKAYGFRDYDHARIALYHALGALPEPPWLTHRFC